MSDEEKSQEEGDRAARILARTMLARLFSERMSLMEALGMEEEFRLALDVGAPLGRPGILRWHQGEATYVAHRRRMTRPDELALALERSLVSKGFESLRSLSPWMEESGTVYAGPTLTETASRRGHRLLARLAAFGEHRADPAIFLGLHSHVEEEKEVKKVEEVEDLDEPGIVALQVQLLAARALLDESNQSLDELLEARNVGT